MVLGVREEEIRTLNPGHWIDSSIINTYSQLIMKRSQQNTLPSVFITPLEYTNEILYPQGSTNITDSPILTLEVFNKHMIFFPIHYQHHYSVVVYYPHLSKLEFHDSIQTHWGFTKTASQEHKEITESYLQLPDIINYVISVLRKHYKLPHTVIDTIIRKDIPTQKNVNDCGLFAINTMENLSRGCEPTMTEAKLQNMRLKILHEIEQNTIIEDLESLNSLTPHSESENLDLNKYSDFDLNIPLSAQKKTYI